MKQLSEECIKAIEDSIVIADLFTMNTVMDEKIKDLMAASMQRALLDESIYTKADLISKEDALGFAIWIDDSIYTYVGGQWTNGISKQSSEQLYNQYQQTK